MISSNLICSFCQKYENNDEFLCGPLIGPFELKSNSYHYIHLYCLYYSWDICLEKSLQLSSSNTTPTTTTITTTTSTTTITTTTVSNTNNSTSTSTSPSLSSSHNNSNKIEITELEMSYLCNDLKNVVTNYNRTALNRCCECKKVRATVGCSISKCPSQYHFPCAQSHVKFFYCSMAYILEKGSYGLIRPTRFIVCNNHAEWKNEWKELLDHLNMLSSQGVEYFNVDKFPLHLQNLVSQASEISLYRPDTLKLVDQNKSLYSIQSVLGPKDCFPSYTIKSLKQDTGRILIHSSDDYIMNTSIRTNPRRTNEKRLLERNEIIEDHPKNKLKRLNESLESSNSTTELNELSNNLSIESNTNIVSTSSKLSSKSTSLSKPSTISTLNTNMKTNINNTTKTKTTLTTTTTTSNSFNDLHNSDELSTSLDSSFIPSYLFQITNQSFNNSCNDFTKPFTCWGINFQGFPDIINNKLNENFNTNENNSNNNNHSNNENNNNGNSTNINTNTNISFVNNFNNDNNDYCGICASIVTESDTLKCLTCPLILHKSCLEYTNLKINLSDIDPNEWSCPICSLCLYCNTQSKSRLKSQNLTRDDFKCTFCSENSPLIFMERLRSGLFAHSICRFIVNIEETISSNCTICGQSGSLIKCGSTNCKNLYHSTCGWKMGYSFSKSIPSPDSNLSLISFCPSHGPSGYNRCHIKIPSSMIEHDVKEEVTESIEEKEKLMVIEQKEEQEKDQEKKLEKVQQQQQQQQEQQEEVEVIKQEKNHNNNENNNNYKNNNDVNKNENKNENNNGMKEFIQNQNHSKKKQLLPTYNTFRFEIGNYNLDVYDVEYFPLFHNSLSSELLSLESILWTRLLTKERFNKSQIDFPVGLTNRSLTCVVGIKSNSMDSTYFSQDNAVGCLPDTWEFIMLLDKRHFIFSILQDIYSDDIKSNKMIEEVFEKSQYFMVGFKRGWRITKKVSNITKKPQGKINNGNNGNNNSGNNNSNNSVTTPKQIEISKGNFIVTDFGKAKLLKPISNTQNNNSNNNNNNNSIVIKKKPQEQEQEQSYQLNQNIKNPANDSDNSSLSLHERGINPSKSLSFNRKNISSYKEHTSFTNDNYNITGHKETNKLTGIIPSKFGKVSNFKLTSNSNKNLETTVSESPLLLSSTTTTPSTSSTTSLIAQNQHQISPRKTSTSSILIPISTPDSHTFKDSIQSEKIHAQNVHNTLQNNLVQNNNEFINSKEISSAIISNPPISASLSSTFNPELFPTQSASFNYTINPTSISTSIPFLNALENYDASYTTGYSELTSIQMEIPSNK